MSPLLTGMLKLSQTGNYPQKLSPDFHYNPYLWLEHPENLSTGSLVLTDELVLPLDMVTRTITQGLSTRCWRIYSATGALVRCRDVKEVPVHFKRVH